MNFPRRINLSESLEQYASRFNPSAPIDSVRTTWRMQGLHFLNLEHEESKVMYSGARIAPGVAVPTKEQRYG